MFTVKRYSADPVTQEAEFLGSRECPKKAGALLVALNGSMNGDNRETDYLAVYDNEGEQIAGFQDGKRVH